MTIASILNIGASSTLPQSWKTINWEKANSEVRQLQMRIAKAVSEGRHGKAKALQWLLTHSYSAKALAVKRVTSSSGAKTPGVDGIVWKTLDEKIQAINSMQRRGYQPKPLRRIYVPKKQKESTRPISIPCLKDRAMQSLHLSALEPVMEQKADKNSYGFRPKRSCADAIEQCFIALSKRKSAQFVLEGDIHACFESISGKWLENNIMTDKVILSKWLNAGYMGKGGLHPTYEVSQGATISPALLVLTLSGLEEAVKSATSLKDKVNVVIYADDFVVTGATKEVLENKVKPAVTTFLKERGLELSLKKTKITHVDEGFNFLGFNIRKYKGKLLIKPSKESVKQLLSNIRTIIKSHAAIKAEELIRMLNPRIRGWTNYYRHVVASDTFNYVDRCIYESIMRWVKRRHPNKSATWRNKKYFRTQDMRRWIFSAKAKNRKGVNNFLDLFRASELPIRRHVKIRAEANPYDPAYEDYFQKRDSFKKNRHIADQKILNSKLSCHQAI